MEWIWRDKMVDDIILLNLCTWESYYLIACFFQVWCVVSVVCGEKRLTGMWFTRLVSQGGSKDTMADESDYYAILGIPGNASDTDIRKAYVLTEFN